MGALDDALRQLSEARALREAAETRAGVRWRDIVHWRLSHAALEPLEVEESRYLAALARLDESVTQCLRQLNEN